MNHYIFRCIQLVTKWLFVPLPDGTILGNQPVLFSVVVKVNIDCNSNQVSVDEWELVSCRSFSPVSVSTPLMLPLWHRCSRWQQTITLSALLFTASFWMDALWKILIPIYNRSSLMIPTQIDIPVCFYQRLFQVPVNTLSIKHLYITLIYKTSLCDFFLHILY